MIEECISVLSVRDLVSGPYFKNMSLQLLSASNNKKGSPTEGSVAKQADVGGCVGKPVK